MSNRYVVRMAALLLLSSPGELKVKPFAGVQPDRANCNTWFCCQRVINVCLQVVPTVTVLAMMKARLTGAVKGHALLKKKADALTLRRAACVRLCCRSPRARRVFAACIGRTVFLIRACHLPASSPLALLPTGPCWRRVQVPPDPEEDRGDEAGDGEDHARRRVCADRGQVRGRRICHHRAGQRGVGACASLGRCMFAR